MTDTGWKILSGISLILGCIGAIVWYLHSKRQQTSVAQQQAGAPTAPQPAQTTFGGWAKKHWLGILAGIIFSPLIYWVLVKVGTLIVALWANQIYGTPVSSWFVDPPVQAAHVVPVTPVDQSNIRLDYFVEGPQKWGWETLPTEVERTFPVDSQEHYTGLNLSLLEGSKLRVYSPGYVGPRGYAALIKTGTTKPVVLQRSGETFSISAADSLSGALMLKWNVRSRNQTPANLSLTFEVSPAVGHTRIATWKVAEGGKNLHWGDLPSPGEFVWNLYFRFADEQGITLSPSVMQEYPATIRIGNLQTSPGSATDAPQMRHTTWKAKVLSESERVLGQNLVTEVNRFLTISLPDIPGTKVRVEVILDVVPR